MPEPWPADILGNHSFCFRVRPRRVLEHGTWIMAFGQFWNHSFTLRRRRALLMTETELRLIAAPAMIGLSSQPKNG